MLALQLKETTRHLHAQLDEQPGLRRLLAADLSLAEYKIILATMYGFFKPLEEALSGAVDWQAYGLDWPARCKSRWFEADFRVLGIDEPEVRRWEHLAPPSSAGEAWGYLYVVEGSTLGAQVISRHLKRSLGLGSEQGGRYYAAYGSQTLPMWQGFQEALGRWYGLRRDRIKEPLDAAQRAFVSLNTWLEVVAAHPS